MMNGAGTVCHDAIRISIVYFDYGTQKLSVFSNVSYYDHKYLENLTS